MTPKKTLNLAVPSGLLEEFNTVCRNYGHGKQKGMVLSAALLMFLRADPKKQGECLHEIMAADIAAGVKKMLEDKVRQKRDAGSDDDSGIAAPGPAGKINPAPNAPARDNPMPRKAAKKAGKAVKGISKLPRLDDLKGGK